MSLQRRKFSHFEVFNNAVRISVIRPAGSIVGGFTIEVSEDRREIVRASLSVDDDGNLKVRGTPSESPFKKVLESLRQLDVEVFFLRDTRRLTSTLDDSRATDSESFAHLDIRMASDHSFQRAIKLTRRRACHCHYESNDFFQRTKRSKLQVEVT